MPTILKRVFMGMALLIITFSCTHTESSDELQASIREQILQLDDPQEAFFNLNEDDQTTVWLEKLDQLLTIEDLPTELYLTIRELRKELNDNGYDSISNSDQFHVIAREVEALAPVVELYFMFGSLSDYRYPGSFDLDAEYYVPHENPLENNASSKGSCNCKWLCGSSGSSSCTPTKYGCGLLWLASCSKMR